MDITKSQTATEECDFCLRLDPNYARINWFDFAVLGTSDNFHVVAALGAIAPGHILIVSNQHVPSMAALPDSARRELLRLVECWARRLAIQFVGEVVLFEHGSLSAKVTGGSCIVHAHWQLVPFPEGLATAPHSFQPHPLSEISRLAARDYLLMANSAGIFVSPDGWTSSRHQFWRRRLLASIGREQEWDYLTYPNVDDMELTVDALRADGLPIALHSGRDFG